MTVARGRASLEAGGDLVFVPGLVDPATVRQVATAIGGPISLMVVPGAPPAAELFAAGASRVSLGPAAMLATLGTLRAVAEEIRDTRRWDALERTPFSFAEADALFADR